MSTISLEVKYQINRVKLYTNLYTKKETSTIKSWFSVTSARFKLATS